MSKTLAALPHYTWAVKILRWFVLDLVLVLVFVAIGRATHDEGVTAAGMVSTGWPFVVALLVGWLAAVAWRSPQGLRTGAIVWIITVVGGLGLRVGLTEETAEVPFIIVATITMALLLLGWRLFAHLLLSRRDR